MTRKLLALVLGVGVLVSAAPIVAHHSVSAEFDTTKTVTFTGKVTEVNWGNPHIYTSVEATDPDTGKVAIFKVEGGAPNALFRNGWRKDTLKDRRNGQGHRQPGQESRLAEHRTGHDSHRIRQARVCGERRRAGHAVNCRKTGTLEGDSDTAVPFFCWVFSDNS